MRAFSVLQPWAAALACGVKRVETRSCDHGAKVGESIAIHASAKPCVASSPVLGRLSRSWRARADSNRGVILATRKVLAVGRVEPGGLRLLRGNGDLLTSFDDDLERSMGDWAPGRVLTFFDCPRVLRSPVPARGALGLWTLPDSALRAVMRGGGADCPTCNRSQTIRRSGVDDVVLAPCPNCSDVAASSSARLTEIQRLDLELRGHELARGSA